MNKVITQEDLDSNPILTEIGATVGDTVAATKPEATADGTGDKSSETAAA